jgi:hypothetical protein
MRPLRFIKRAALLIVVSAVILVAGVSVYLRIEQYRFRRQAERLLSDVRELELEKASAEQVKVVVRKWGFEEWQGPGKPCNEDECIFRFQLVPKAAQDRFSNPFISALIARPLEWLGLRPAVVNAEAQMRGKALISVSLSVWTLGRECDGQGRLECTLMGYADTKQRRSGWSSHEQPDVKLKQSLLHPNYLVGALHQLLNADTGGSPGVIVWAEFSPDANTQDVSRLMQFDLSCLTRLLSCTERDLMPTVWAQSIEDIRLSPRVLTCTPELVLMLIRAPHAHRLGTPPTTTPSALVLRLVRAIEESSSLRPIDCKEQDLRHDGVSWSLDQVEIEPLPVNPLSIKVPLEHAGPP